MACFVIEGGRRLSGDIQPQGAKNEALQILSAVLLTEERVEVDNLPEIEDVNRLLEMLEYLGVTTQAHGPGHISFCAKDINPDKVFSSFFFTHVGRLRGSVMLLAPLLQRFGRVELPDPGGDKIGRRHLDTHIRGLQALGACFEYNTRKRSYTLWITDGFRGSKVLLEEASVTGTANLLMAAACAKGNTILYHAACEPYIQQLCVLLQSMGAQIEGVGTNCLKVVGREGLLGGASHRLQTDIIEVGSFIGAAALTGSEIRIKDPNLPQLGMIISMFERLGIEVMDDDDSLLVPAQPHYRVHTSINGSIMNIYDGIWPALSPDMISIGIVTALQAEGAVLFHQRMFDSRLFFVDKLIDMGGRLILCDPHRVTVIGLARQLCLQGIRMVSPVIRAGVALLLAALAAEGESIIENVEQIDRGYTRIEERLNKLGAKITREA